MKQKTFFNCFILSFLVLSFAKAQNIQFENAKFKKVLLSASPDNKIAKDVNGKAVAIDTNGDGEISQAEALNIYYLNISGEQGVTSIKSIKGIEYFTNLTVLRCSYISEPPITQRLSLPRIGIKTIDISKNINLQYLDLSGTEIKTLDISKNINLQTLVLNFSGIEVIDLSKNTNLQTLHLSGTKIKTLDISKNINLQILSLYMTGIQILDLSKNINLQELDLGSTEIKTLDVSKNINLQELDLDVTGIETLDISKNINLQTLDLRNNTGIKTLDVSKNINLEALWANYTEITTLDVSHNTKLISLVLYNCPKLTSLYMKNGVKKIFNTETDDNNIYNFAGTNLNYICCDKNERSAVKRYIQRINEEIKSYSPEYPLLNPTITSDCGTESTKEIPPQEKTASYPNP